MANIANLIKNIRTAVFGKDVRESIAKSIEQTYEDATRSGNANMEVSDARGYYSSLKNRLDGDKNDLQTQINGLASGSPLVASSVSEMTDTSRVYVNTSNGKWYYYNGSNWVIGGNYQSTNIDNNSVNESMLDNILREAIYKEIGTRLDIDNADIAQFIKNYNGSYFSTSFGIKSLIVPIQKNTKYIVQKVLSQRFALFLSENYPADNIAISNFIQDNTATELQITSGDSDNYLTILYWHTSDTLTEIEIRNSIKVYINEVKDDLTQAEYLENKIDNIDLFSNKYINLLSNRNLGVLTKGYIAISCDDGGNDLADITINLFKGYKSTYNKNIPLTMALMSNSQIFNDTTRKTKVLDLINNYGASVAIHGATPYTEYSQSELFSFLDYQKEFITENLAPPTSIIYPNHDYNKSSSTIAGSYYGVCCTGGINTPITYGGNSKCAGPRSNMYTLYRFSLFGSSVTTEIIKNAIDYAYEHNMIFLPFFHDIKLANDYERCKNLLDYCVQYANQKGLEFINIGDINTII